VGRLLVIYTGTPNWAIRAQAAGRRTNVVDVVTGVLAFGRAVRVGDRSAASCSAVVSGMRSIADRVGTVTAAEQSYDQGVIISEPWPGAGSERRSRRSEPRGTQLKSNSPFFTPAMKSRHSETE
jgi:hypothetical protein